MNTRITQGELFQKLESLAGQTPRPDDLDRDVLSIFLINP